MLWNQGEVRLVVRYLRLLKPQVRLSEVSVVSPYRLCTEKIKKALIDEFGSKAATDLEVDVTERFQGQEKQVMIVSTVRSKIDGGQKLDFLR